MPPFLEPSHVADIAARSIPGPIQGLCVMLWGVVSPYGNSGMKQHRLPLGTVIGTTTGTSVVYLISILLEWRAGVVFALLVLSMVAMAWMAVRILKDPYSTDKTFDDQFYLDRDDLRRNGRE